MGKEPETPRPPASPSWCLVVVAASAAMGLALIADQAVRMSATYDEVAYLRVAARWWRTGDQAEITRMGSPLTFWKLQQGPTLWALDRLGLEAWVDDPISHQSELLPIARIGASWIWLVALLIGADWARRLHGPRGMAMASVLFAISPNLLAHGSLLTMELPLVASSSAMFFSYWSFLKTGSRRNFWTSAALGGLAMSCKFTTVLFPPILALLRAIDLGLVQKSDSPGPTRRPVKLIRDVGLELVRFVAVMIASNLLLTGFATIHLSPRGGPHPVLEGRLNPTLGQLANRALESSYPQDWVGFAAQVVHQRSGGPSYLMGERRTTGWTSYYLVCLAVKVPLAFWLLAIGRTILRGQSSPKDRDWSLPVLIVAFLLLAMVGSKRNYGFRYLLPMATPAIVWVSGLAEGGRRSKWVAGLGLAGMGLSLALIHPYELSYFNELAGGPIGGRRILADSNLDWGQGAKSLTRLQRARPEFRDLTLFYFGDTDPRFYGVEGRRFVIDANRVHDELPVSLTVETRFLAVSASLQWGPWGPPDYFRDLDRIEPLAYTDDSTIAVYRASDLQAFRRGRGPG